MLASATAMTVSFFEEFPDETTVEKMALIDFDTRIYVAARNLSEFYDYEEDFKSKNKQVTGVIYWPVLEREEGYWISPWADAEALERIFNEVKERKDKRRLGMLLDLEPPLKRLRLLNFNFKNKRKITEFIRTAEEHNISISTVEKSYIPDWLLELFGLSFEPEKYGNRKIKMYYSSYRRQVLPDFVVDMLLERKVKKYARDKTTVGLGLIAPGIHDETHRITPDILQRELEIASDLGIKEVIIFRLEGLDEEYLKAIR